MSPLLVGMMFSHPVWVNLPFFLAGTIKIAYDLCFYWRMASVPIPELSAS